MRTMTPVFAAKLHKYFRTPADIRLQSRHNWEYLFLSNGEFLTQPYICVAGKLEDESVRFSLAWEDLEGEQDAMPAAGYEFVVPALDVHDVPSAFRAVVEHLRGIAADE